MSNVLILGGYGLLGNSLADSLSKNKHNVMCQSRSTGEYICDPNDSESLLNLIRKTNPEVIINLIASTNVNLCEDDIAYAYNGNIAPLVAYMNATQFMKSQPFLLHISTDHVYDGIGPSKEIDVKLLNNYAKTKWLAEKAVININSCILRTNFIGASRNEKRISFTDWIYNSLIAEIPISVYTDVYFSPLHISTLSDLINFLIIKQKKGLYNLGSSSGVSKAELAFCMAEELGLSRKLLARVRMTDSVNNIKRPFDMRMNSDSFSENFQIALPKFHEEVTKVIKEYRNA